MSRDRLQVTPDRYRTLGEIHNLPSRQIYFMKKPSSTTFDTSGFELISGGTDKVLITGTTDKIIVKVPA